MQLQTFLAVIEKKVERGEIVDSDELFNMDVNAARAHPAVNAMLQFMHLPIIVADWPSIIESRDWRIISLTPGTYRRDGTLQSIKIVMHKKQCICRGCSDILDHNMARFRRLYEAEMEKRKAAGTHV